MNTHLPIMILGVVEHLFRDQINLCGWEKSYELFSPEGRKVGIFVITTAPSRPRGSFVLFELHEYGRNVSSNSVAVLPKPGAQGRRKAEEKFAKRHRYPYAFAIPNPRFPVNLLTVSLTGHLTVTTSRSHKGRLQRLGVRVLITAPGK